MNKEVLKEKLASFLKESKELCINPSFMYKELEEVIMYAFENLPKYERDILLTKIYRKYERFVDDIYEVK
jgi:hypothetical protein